MDEVIIGMSLRDEVEADLLDDLAERVRHLIGAQCDADVFRDRLVHILTRYETYLAGAKTASRNDHRRQLTKLHGKAQAFLAALDAIHPEVRQSLDSRLDAQTSDSRWCGFDVLDQDQPMPEDDDSLKQAEVATTNILKACQLEIDFLDATNGAKRKSGHLALDQLLIDLGALYEDETGHSAKSQCYHDVTCEDEYSGFFFAMTKTLLDGYAPRAYSTAQGLGKRIERVLGEK